VVGLAAALAHRGLRTVRLPSTTLAQNDAGIGVKTGLNLAGQKNAVGVFAPPWAVIDDFDFLDTLDDENWIAGHAEAFKVAAIRDAAFFDFLCAHASALRRRDPVAQEQAVTRCAERHLRHIRDSGDPFETGTARPLDFGHWAAHQLETMTGYALRHGPAVAIGVALDAAYARRKGWLTPGDFERLTGGLRACGFTLWHPAMAERRPDGVRVLFEGIEKFREHLGGELTITMPRGIGDRFEIHDLDRAVLDACADELREPKAFSPC
jgi:3-dehydroquinate synthase